MITRFFISMVLVGASVSHAMCADKLERLKPTARFNERVSVLGKVLYFDDRRVDAPYYVDAQGNLFNEHGFEVVSIDNKIIFGGLEWRVEYDRSSTLLYNVESGVTIRRGEGHSIGGVGFDSYLYVGKHRCTGHGPGFYLHRGHVRDPAGRRVTEIEYVGNGHCHITVSNWF